MRREEELSPSILALDNARGVDRLLETAHALLAEIRGNVERVVVGKDAEVALAIIGIAAGGHLLIEDVPGVGKTMLARSLARSLGGTFKRVQFTPDLLPSDVTGIYIFNQANRTFDFRPGPLFAHVVLADEINRATPKTQSALLEAMEERQVTVDGTSHALPVPFTILATQNPIEYEGTFPLPESQLDRFLLRIHLGYPSPSDEARVLQAQAVRHPIEDLRAVASPERIVAAQRSVRRVHVHPSLERYVVEVVGATRRHDDVYLGASPRGSLSLVRASQARALLEGRDYVLPDDVQALAPAVLGHRVILQPEARLRGLSSMAIVEGIIESVPVPAARLPA